VCVCLEDGGGSGGHGRQDCCLMGRTLELCMQGGGLEASDCMCECVCVWRGKRGGGGGGVAFEFGILC